MGTTGSTVLGTVPGLPEHLGGGASMMFVIGNPSGIVSGFEPGTGASHGVSGNVIAYDTANHQYYMHEGGTANALWVKLGSVA